MITAINRARIRRAYYQEGKSRRQIARDQQHGHSAIRKVLESAEHQPYALTKSKPAPKLVPYKAKRDKLMPEKAKLPRK